MSRLVLRPINLLVDIDFVIVSESMLLGPSPSEDSSSRFFFFWVF